MRTVTAKEFIASLPRDEESPDRAQLFQELIASAARSEKALSLVRSVYNLAGSPAWPCSSLHDINMLLFSLDGRPELLGEVRPDVERLLKQLFWADHPVWQRWQRLATRANQGCSFDGRPVPGS